MSDTITMASPFLPPPRLPNLSRDIDADDVAAVAGEELAQPLRDVEQAHRDAQQALDDLSACRPGQFGDGHAWRAAVEQDKQAYVDGYADGRQPKVWATERLVREDPHRWALALSACAGFTRLRDEFARQLNRETIAERASLTAETRRQTWTQAALDGWNTRGDHAVAWQHRRAGEQVLNLYRLAVRVRAWAIGQPLPQPDRDAVPPTYDDLPFDVVARGRWLALGLALEPTTVWLRLPDPLQVRMPDGSDDLLHRAVPGSGERFRGLRNEGVHAVER